MTWGVAWIAFLVALGVAAAWFTRKRPPTLQRVYVAAPFAPVDTLDSRQNTERAQLLAGYYERRGHRVVCVHPAILRGRYGDDTDPAARARGMRRTMALCRAVAESGGILAVLLTPEGRLSRGTAAEVAAFLASGGAWVDVHIWRWPLDEAAPHRSTVDDARRLLSGAA